MFKPEISEQSVLGRWTVIRRHGSSKRNERLYLCRCICGVEKLVPAYALSSGQSKSCGCLKRDMQRENKTSHAMSTSRAYSSWHNMVQRCTNPNNKAWINYGGRGITVAEEWLKFDVFISDMGERPDGYTLERKDNNRGYSKDNCEWATRKAQANNRRVVRRYKVGEELLTIGEIAKREGTTYMVIWHKLHKEQGVST